MHPSSNFWDITVISIQIASISALRSSLSYTCRFSEYAEVSNCFHKEIENKYVHLWLHT